MEKALEILKEILDTQDLSYKVVNNVCDVIKEIEAVMKPKTCLDCKHYSQSTFYGDLKVVKYCHENRLGIGDINFQIFCCNKWEAKDNA